MKLLGNIEVSGIEEVVFYRATIWRRFSDSEGYSVWLKVSNGINGKTSYLEDEEMMKILRHKFGNPNYHVWISNSTINITRPGEK
jgi:hypothetical protein